MQMSEAITVIARIRARPGKEPETGQLLTGLIEPTRNEQGCISYDLFAMPDNPGSYMFIETWQSRKHLNVHAQQPHVQALIRCSDELLAEPLDISIWKHITRQ